MPDNKSYLSVRVLSQGATVGVYTLQVGERTSIRLPQDFPGPLYGARVELEFDVPAPPTIPTPTVPNYRVHVTQDYAASRPFSVTLELNRPGQALWHPLQTREFKGRKAALRAASLAADAVYHATQRACAVQVDA